MVSAPVPPVSVSTLETVADVGEVAEGQRVGAGAEIDRAGGDGGAERDRVGTGAAGDGLDVGDGGGVGEVAERELSVPAPRSMVPPVTWRGERDGVGAGAAGEGLDVGDA